MAWSATDFSRLVDLQMNRVQFMTTGLVLAFIGAQLYFIDTYVLTSQATKVIGQTEQSLAAEGLTTDPNQNDNFGQSSYYSPSFRQASYANTTSSVNNDSLKRISHPKWICWPVFFLGAVFFLHGLALPSSSEGS